MCTNFEMRLYLLTTYALLLIISGEILNSTDNNNNNTSNSNTINSELSYPIPEFKPLVAITEFFTDDINRNATENPSTTELSVEINEPLILTFVNPNLTQSKDNSDLEANTSIFNSDNLPKFSLIKDYLTVKDLPKCVKNEFKFNECFIEILEVVLHYFRNNESNSNSTRIIGGLEPLVFNSSKFHYHSGAFNMDLNVKGAHLYGLTYMQYRNVLFVKDEQNLTVNVTSHIPKLEAFGTYSGQLRFGSNWQWRLNGNFSITITNVQLSQHYEGFISKQKTESGLDDNRNILQFTSVQLQPKIKDIQVNATGLLNDPQLNEIVLNAINRYGQQIFQVLITQYQDYWSKIFLQFTNEAFRLAPFKFQH